jgi:hypothetical protein
MRPVRVQVAHRILPGPWWVVIGHRLEFFKRVIKGSDKPGSFFWIDGPQTFIGRA